jgi:hypothetical protein
VPSGFWLSVRTGPKVTRERFDTLDAALEGLQAAAVTIAHTAHREPIDLKVRRFEPEAQVAARVEVAGPGRLLPATRGGVDVRGDGSVEAYVGGVRRRVVQRRGGESPYAALRRALGRS